MQTSNMTSFDFRSQIWAKKEFRLKFEILETWETLEMMGNYVQNLITSLFIFIWDVQILVVRSIFTYFSHMLLDLVKQIILCFICKIMKWFIIKWLFIYKVYLSCSCQKEWIEHDHHILYYRLLCVFLGLFLCRHIAHV